MFSLLIALRNVVIIVLLSWLGFTGAVDTKDEQDTSKPADSQIGFNLLR